MSSEGMHVEVVDYQMIIHNDVIVSAVDSVSALWIYKLEYTSIYRANATNRIFRLTNN